MLKNADLFIQIRHFQNILNFKQQTLKNKNIDVDKENLTLFLTFLKSKTRRDLSL